LYSITSSKDVNIVLDSLLVRRSKDDSDDNLGSLALIMAYVDDANFLVSLEDVKPLLDAFKSNIEPFSLAMNTEKIWILTATNGHIILPQLRRESLTIYDFLLSAIIEYSREKVDSHITQPLEVATSLIVFGAPIGSHIYCNSFHRTTKL